MADASDRLARLLGLVPYLSRNPGTTIDTVASAFGVSRAQIVDDLELLFVTGRPGHMPDDLIEVNWEGDQIFVDNAEEVSVPVRLSAREARALFIALDYLAQIDGADYAVIRSVRAKVVEVANLGERGESVDLSVPTVPADLASAVRFAIDHGEGLSLDYYVASRDELTHRLITPQRLRLEGRWYLDAWCHTSGGPRTFAVGEIRSFAPASVPQGQPHELRVDRGQAGEDGVVVDLTLAPNAAWLADDVEHLRADYDVAGPGSVKLRLRVFSRDWLTRLLLAHGTDVINVEPPHLAADAARIASQAARQQGT